MRKPSPPPFPAHLLGYPTAHTTKPANRQDSHRTMGAAHRLCRTQPLAAIQSQPVTFRLHGPWKICRPCLFGCLKSDYAPSEHKRAAQGAGWRLPGQLIGHVQRQQSSFHFQPDILQLAGCSMTLSCRLAEVAVRLHQLGMQCGRVAATCSQHRNDSRR